MLARLRSVLRWPHPIPRPNPRDLSDTGHRARQPFGVMFAVDIADFSSRPAFIQERLRAILYKLVEDAGDRAGVRWRHCIREDRGDGMFVINASETDFAVIVNKLASRLAAGLDNYNQTATSEAGLKMRMAVHVGYYQSDKYGVISPDLIQTFRLLDAPQLKRQLADRADNLALIISDYVYRAAASYNHIDPIHYRRVTFTIKGEKFRAWIRNTQP